ncbi:MAG: phosphate acyltransferase PlsX [Candidatus Schekmanbacteria bacterium]|nr:phosphate acyltransferase PlsX [Candidatus Schekmanbacteria bacterium]
MIAVDAMGGDFAPHAVVAGACEAARDFGIKVALVGRREKILGHIPERGVPKSLIEIVHSNDVVTMDDIPSESYYKKPDSSLSVGLSMVRDNKADAFVSAGNTGALMYSAINTIKLIPGIIRPSITTRIPTSKGYCLLLDSGANVDCKPQWLLQFAIMGHIYSAQILGKGNPSIGLLSNGTEKTKGNRLVQETYELIAGTSLNFIGNIEPSDVFAGKADIVVADGFVGNIFLKSLEGFGNTCINMFRNESSHGVLNKIGSYFVKSAVGNTVDRLDFANYGGSPLLGLNGICVVCHGRSSATAIKNAIRAANDFSSKNFNKLLVDEITRIQEEQTEAPSGKKGLWANIVRAFRKGREK